jgi:hypothetical protein
LNNLATSVYGTFETYQRALAAGQGRGSQDLKVAMAEDGTAASHIVEELVRDWLVKRKVRK